MNSTVPPHATLFEGGDRGYGRGQAHRSLLPQGDPAVRAKRPLRLRHRAGQDRHRHLQPRGREQGRNSMALK